MDAGLCFGFPKTKWKDLSRKLDDGDQDAWAEGIGVFERRMRERFFSSIDALFDADTKPDLPSADLPNKKHCIPGFSIMALCCLLIETLQSFREEAPHRSDPTGPCTFPDPGPCIKPPSGSNQQFRAFLCRPAFGTTFDETTANKFIDGIRNGIIHDCETRKWVIWRDEPKDKIVATEGDGFAVNRGLFYAAVELEFESYLQELRDPANRALRERFKKKMDDLEKDKR